MLARILYNEEKQTGSVSSLQVRAIYTSNLPQFLLSLRKIWTNTFGRFYAVSSRYNVHAAISQMKFFCKVLYLAMEASA